MKKGNPAHQPTALTPKMKRFLTQLIERFGDSHNNVKRAELKKAARELLGTLAAPRWITRNMSVRTTRGMYDLSVLAKLPLVQEDAAPVRPTEQEPEEAPKTKTVPKTPKKKSPKPKKDPEPTAETVGSVESGD
jgi:hypothetical protein